VVPLNVRMSGVCCQESASTGLDGAQHEGVCIYCQNFYQTSTFVTVQR